MKNQNVEMVAGDDMEAGFVRSVRGNALKKSHLSKAERKQANKERKERRGNREIKRQGAWL